MAIETKRVYRVRTVEETAFAVDQSGTMSAFEPIKFTAATVSLDMPRVSANVMQAKMDSASQRVSGLKRATLTLTVNLAGQTVRAGNGTTHTQTELGKMFRCWLGGRRLGQGDLFAADCDEGELNVDVGARWEAGCGIGLINDDGRFVARAASAAAANEVDLWNYFATADIPSDGDVAYAAASYFLGASASDATDNKTLQAACEGLAQDDRWLLLGGKVTDVTFALGRGAIAQATITIKFANWIYGANATTDLTADSSPLTYDADANNGLPLSVIDSDLMACPYGVPSAGTVLHAETFAIKCSPQWVMINSTSGPSGCGAIGWARNQSPDVVTGNFTIPFDSPTWFATRDLADYTGWVSLHFQVGSIASEGCALIVAHVQITNVQPVEVNGLSYQNVEFVGGVPIQADATDILDSPFAIHLF